MIDIRIRPALALAVVRRRARPGELSRVVPAGCGLVWKALGAQDVRGGRNVALYLNDAIDLCAGVEAVAPFRADGELVAAETPAGEVASLVHHGPYATLAAAHDAIHAWSRSSGRQLAGPRWELYDHWDAAWDAHPERIRTEVCYLLVPGSGPGR